MKTKSYKPIGFTSTKLKVNDSVQGETIEQKMHRIINNKEPIKDGAPLIYTERKDGVQAGYNIKTDRFEVALEAINKIEKSKTAKREAKAEMNIVKDDENKDVSGAESIQGTNQ